MIGHHETSLSMPLGIVLRRSPGVTRWAKWVWRAVAVLPGAGPADGKVLHESGDVTEFHAATVSLDLHRADTEAYLHGMSARVPCLYIVLRETDEGDWPYEVLLATASPYEAQDYCDAGEELVEKVTMPPALMAWIEAFVQEHHVEEEFVKRKRDRKRIDLTEDGIGDPRIAQVADVYRSPSLKRKRVLQ